MPLTPGAADSVAQQIVAALNVPEEGREQATANWKAVVSAIFSGITQNAQVVPSALAAPSGGGAVTGTGNVV